MKGVLFFRFLTGIFFVTTAMAIAGEPPPPAAEISLKAEVNKAFITIGDPVEYTVTIRHSPEVQVLSSIPPPGEDFLKIKKVEDIHPSEGTALVEGRKYTLTAFQLGEFVLEPVQIQYRVGGGEAQTLTAEKIFLTVKSVAEGEVKTDIRGIKQVLAMPLGRTGLLFTLILLILGVSLILFRILGRKKTAILTPAEPLLSPEEQALGALHQLFDSDWIRRGKFREYYLRFSEILRLYFERRLQIAALEATTEEILRAMRQQELPLDLRTQIQDVLEFSDLAKFAKWKPEPLQVVKLNQKSKQIVEEASRAGGSENGV